MDAERIAELRRLARHAEGSPHGGSVLLAEWLTEALGALEASRAETAFERHYADGCILRLVETESALAAERAKVERLRSALKPFANTLCCWCATLTWYCEHADAARAALEETRP